jgi:hypothetical protein
MNALPLLDLTSLDTWTDIGRAAGIIVAAYAGILWVSLIYWTYRDVSARSSDIWTRAFYVLLVAMFFVPGLLVYLALRPHELLVDTYNRNLEAEAFRQEIEKHPTCSTCRRAVREDFILCPYCRTTLREACMECGAYLAAAWIACPYCASERRYAAATRLVLPHGGNGNGQSPARRAATPERPRTIRPQTSHY